MSDAPRRCDPKELPHADRMAVGAVFKALANSWGAHPERERTILALLFDTLALTESDRYHIARLVGPRRDPTPYATQIRDPDLRAVLLLEMLALALANGTYDARDREGLRRLAAALDVEWTTVVAAEDRFADAVRSQGKGRPVASVSGSPAKDAPVPASTGPSRTPTGGDFLKACFQGLSDVAATGAGLVFLGAGAAAAGGIGPTGDPVELGRIFGAAGRAIVADKFAALEAAPTEFAFERLSGDGMHVFVAVPGWLSQTADVAEKWGPLSALVSTGARYSLRWESKDLLALRDWLSAIAAKTTRTDPHGEPATPTGPGPAWPVAATAPFDLIDNPWHMAARRATQTGAVLAERLRARHDFGCRPVSLIGFSLGARVIFRALEELARTRDYGIVYQTILLGGAFTADRRQWEQVRRVVSGPVVNAYCTTDWVLAVAYRAAEFAAHAAGLGPVGVAGIEDVDVTHLSGGHLGYERALGAILQRVGVVP